MIIPPMSNIDIVGVLLCQGLVAERLRSLPCNRKIASSIPAQGHFAAPFSNGVEFGNAEKFPRITK